MNTKTLTAAVAAGLVAVAVSALLSGDALADRNAGSFAATSTVGLDLGFSPNPDGGASCANARGTITTDGGISMAVSTFPICPRTAAQAARVAACEAITVSLVNASQSISDGGL